VIKFKQGFYIYAQTFTNGYTKVLRFSDVANLDLMGDDEEVVDDAISKDIGIFDIQLQQINLSIISQAKELLTIYFQKILAKVIDSEKDTKAEMQISYLQIDNQSEFDPIYPVLLKPKEIKPEEDSSHSSRGTIAKPVYQMSLHLRKGIQRVVYLELIDFLLQTLVIKLEYSHIILVSKFVSVVGGALNTNLTWTH